MSAGITEGRPFRVLADAFGHFNDDDGWAMASHAALSPALFPFLLFVATLAGTFGGACLAREVAELVFDAWPSVSGQGHRTADCRAGQHTADDVEHGSSDHRIPADSDHNSSHAICSRRAGMELRVRDTDRRATVRCRCNAPAPATSGFCRAGRREKVERQVMVLFGQIGLRGRPFVVESGLPVFTRLATEDFAVCL